MAASSPQLSGSAVPTCEDAVLLSRLLPADLQRGVQDLTEAQVSYRPRHCTPKGTPHPTQCQLDPGRDYCLQDSPRVSGAPQDERLDQDRPVPGEPSPAPGWVGGCSDDRAGWCLPSSWVRTSWGLLRGPSPGVVKHSTEVKYSVNFFRPDTKPTWMLSWKLGRAVTMVTSSSCSGSQAISWGEASNSGKAGRTFQKRPYALLQAGPLDRECPGAQVSGD